MTGQADMHFMQLALAQAKAGAIAGEVPVGAVVVKDGAVDRKSTRLNSSH